MPEAIAPSEAPGFVERFGCRIGDNFTQAFSTPLGPGEAYRDFVSPLTTPTGYGAFDAVAQPLYNGALIGVPSLLDAAGRTIGAAYYSLVDGGTELLTSAGMDPSSAERLGRDLKAMPEAFAGSPGAIMRPAGPAVVNPTYGPSQLGDLTLRSLSSNGEIFDPAKLSRIQSALERQGVSFVTGDEGARFARTFGGEALYMPTDGQPGIMAFGPKPTRTQVIEELIHYGQHKASGFGDLSNKVATLEVQAQNKLLQVGPRLGWSPDELAQIERALGVWQERVPTED